MEQPLQPGTQVSGYEIQEFVGQGTFSRVYAVRDLQNENQPQRALLESILHGDAQERQLRQRTFQRAAEVLEKVSDPAIPKIYHFFQERDSFYIVQELVAGWDYGRCISGEKPPLSADEVERVLWETLSGLAQLHDAKIVHRDIKPSNLLRRDADGSTVIVDFGSACDLSRLATAATQMPGVTHKAGHTQIYTPGYAHPDQREGLVAATPQWDLYALAKTIVALCLGSDPPWQQPWAVEGLGLSLRAQRLLQEMLKIQECRLLDARDALSERSLVLPDTAALQSEAVPRKRQPGFQFKRWHRWVAVFAGASFLSAAATAGVLYAARRNPQTTARASDRCPTYVEAGADVTEPTRGFAARFQYPETALPGSSVLEIHRNGKLLARANDDRELGFIQVESLTNGTNFPAGKYQLKLFVPSSIPYEEEVTLDTDSSVIYLGRSQPLEQTCSNL